MEVSESSLSVTLPAEDTALIAGKLIYQITVTLEDGTRVIPGRGLMFLARNINPDIITGESSDDSEDSDSSSSSYETATEEEVEEMLEEIFG